MGNKPATKIRKRDLEFCRTNTSFSSAEIEDWYKCFHKDCPKGHLTLDNFKLIYAQFLPGDSSTFAELVFRHFDEDNDDKISFCEFLTGLSVTAKGKLDDKLKWAFQLYAKKDRDYIEKSEMLVIVESIYKIIRPIVQLPDDESTAEKRTSKIFSTFDTDRDGKISYDEFIRGAMSDPSIMHIFDADKQISSAASPIRSSENALSSTARLHS